jgi:hypothetical protein
MSRLVIVVRFSKGTPSTWRDCSLNSAALERTEIFGGKLCESHQSGPVPQHQVIGQSPALTVWPVALGASRPEWFRSHPHDQISSFHCV